MNTVVSLRKKVAEQSCRSDSAVHSRVHRVLHGQGATRKRRMNIGRQKRLYLADLRQFNPLPNRALSSSVFPLLFLSQSLFPVAESQLHLQIVHAGVRG